MIERALHKLTLVTLLAAAQYTTRASADEFEAPIFSFSGFGTAAVVHSSERQADFTSSALKSGGAGYGNAWSGDVDSLIGGQVTADFTPKLSAVLQVISEQNSDNTFRPHVEWANVKYQLTPNFSIRAGRTLLPTFLLSDTRKVAYTYPWARPPLEVYHLAPITVSDGVDTSYQFRIGDVTNALQAQFGQSEDKLPAGKGTVKAKQSWGLAYTGEYHAATAHIGYESAHVTLDATRPIFDAFRQFGPEGIAIADRYGANNKSLSAFTIGARYDPGQWFVMGEWGHEATQSFVGKLSGWYVGGGYRLGAFTPYLTYGQAKADNLSDPGVNLSTLPPPLMGPAAGLNAVLNSLLSAKPVQNTVSVGGRWDFMSNAALKLQYDHTRIGEGSSGVLGNLQPGYRTGGKFNVISVKIDFVF
jgi:opacity protein-like surface antigen